MKAKGMVILALVLVLICGVAMAEEYVTLAQLREQAEAGWNETYTAMGREVVANAEMDWFPEADTCPLVHVDPLVIEEEDERLDKWRELSHSSIYALPDRLVIDVNNYEKYRLIKLGGWTGKWLFDEFDYYDGEVPDRKAEDCDITYDEFLALFEADLLELTGLTLNDLHFDEIKVRSASFKGKKVDGEYVRGDRLTAAGGYTLFAKQLVHGVPVIGSHSEMDKGRIQYSYYMPEYRFLTFWSVTNPTVVNEDLPLLSFEAFKGKLEELIEAGKLRGVDGMRFGYGTCKDGDKWTLVPVWMVTCGYTDNPNSDKNVMPYEDSDGSIVAPIGYGERYFSAQTGEMLERYEVNRYEESLSLPKILTWDEIK